MTQPCGDWTSGNRVEDMWALFDKLRFDLNVVVAGDDGEHVAIVYQSTMTTKDGVETAVANIEVFHVVDGVSPRSTTAATSKGSGHDNDRSHA